MSTINSISPNTFDWLYPFLSFTYLESLRKSGCIKELHSSPRLHPNPMFYKYKFHVFWLGRLYQGAAFAETAPLSIKEAFDLMKLLEEKHEPHVVYHHCYPRQGASIWNSESPRWRGVKFAPSYDLDPDPPIEGGIFSGHR